MKLTLGIDFGTTKTAAVIVDENGRLLDAVSAAHNAQLPAEKGAAEQSVPKILESMKSCVKKLPEELRYNVEAIGITGQMHSLLLGNGRGELSPLVTWQDARCGEELLREINQRSGLALREGFGGSTLARLAAAGELGQWSFCATISDYAVAMLTCSTRIVTDPTHAASWGIYNMEEGTWNYGAVEKLGIPAELLPEIRPSGAVAGQLCAEWSRELGLPPNIDVINAIGDNQASILATGKDFASEVYLTLGTGAQLSLVTEHAPVKLNPAFELRPFPGNRLLLVRAPLCGGAAFAWLVKTVNRFRRELGEAELPEDLLFSRLDELAVEVLKSGNPEISVEPHFLGERHNPALRGSISGLALNNAGPGETAAALALGIVNNLCQDLPEELMAGRRLVYGSGNGVRRLKCIQIAIQKLLNLPLQLSEAREEAAVGAALLIRQ